ncbi:MAG: hypothetical protein ACREP7_08425 [Lysobacter sp.]
MHLSINLYHEEGAREGRRSNGWMRRTHRSVTDRSGDLCNHKRTLEHFTLPFGTLWVT